ncbi:hypothetical protein SARC_13025, partial [Sphaeroforma arctica JP610]
IELALAGVAQVAICYLVWKGWQTMNSSQSSTKPVHLPEFILKRLEAKNEGLNEREMIIAGEIVNPDTLTVEWKDIGGLDEQIRDLQEAV